ncbi:winged helix-turn-helix domain-containing protein [Streptomyces olivoreticuli]
MSFPAGLLLETVERLIDTTAHTTTDTPVRGLAHVMCDSDGEPRVRERLTQALTGDNVRLTEMSSRSDKPGCTLLEAAFATQGPITAALSQLLALVWLEPAVSDLHWHLNQLPPARTDEGEPPRAPVHHLHGLVVDLGHRTVTALGRPVSLTCMEFELLAHFLAHPQRAFSHERLMELVWQRSTAGERYTVDTHIAALRRKLGPCYGSVVASVGEGGYLLDPTKAAPRTRGAH